MALIIVLLVTALLIALIFEFAYGTRVSLRAAANFRNSQRAYFLARSGLGFFAMYPQLRDVIPQIKETERGKDDCPPLPYVSEGDREVRLCWEDESGKIDISQLLQSASNFKQLVNLFDIRGVDTNKLTQMSNWMTENYRTKFYMLSELHQFLADEEFGKLQDALTMSGTTKINVNTASEDVLKSVFRSFNQPDAAAEGLARRRTTEAFDYHSLQTYLTMNSLNNLMTSVTTSSNDFKVSLYATVGGYTRHIEAIIKLTGSANPPYTVQYWREF